ncbi:MULTISPECIES: hypothetical protein [unclassified Streptomyces]|uniref:hypothetical protein n=1 Tax=unclassified Streptomyces TaxID=2593676 RepID=UPI0038253076
MNATAPASRPKPASKKTSVGCTRIWSGLAGVLALSTERAPRCPGYGECGPTLPGWLFQWGACLGAAACVVALVAPAVRVRRWALGVQLLAEDAALMTVLGYI